MDEPCPKCGQSYDSHDMQLCWATQLAAAERRARIAERALELEADGLCMCGDIENWDCKESDEWYCHFCKPVMAYAIAEDELYPDD